MYFYLGMQHVDLVKMNINSSGIVFSLLVFICYVECAKILGIVWTFSRSHHILESILLQALAKKGHEVTILSPFRDDVNLTNYKQYPLERSTAFAKDMTAPTTNNIFSFLVSQQQTIQKYSELFWKSASVRNLITSKKNFDVAIILQFDNDAVLALAQQVGAPAILLNPVGATVASKYVGNPNLACYPCPFHLVAVDVRRFFGRLVTATLNAMFYLDDIFIHNPNQRKLLGKYLPEAPPLEEIQKNVSLVLSNSHFSIEPPRSHVANMIQIGGFHIEKPEKLPEDIQDFLDSAEHGAVLFSFGSNVKLASVHQDKLQIFLRGIARISPVKVLLKSEIDLPDVSRNVLVKKWVPQNDVLAHPKIRAFVTHGGLGGTTEAVYHGVPMLGIPFFGDQKANIASTAEAGYTFALDYDDVTQKSFDRALREILTNKMYDDNVKKYSSLLRNQPIKPLDNAIWWIEHIIEHKGGKHLRNVAMDLTWFELYMMDIMLFYLSVFVFLCFLFVRLTKFVFVLIFTEKRDKLKKS